jgi:hypothetical protein
MLTLEITVMNYLPVLVQDLHIGEADQGLRHKKTITVDG